MAWWWPTRPFCGRGWGVSRWRGRSSSPQTKYAKREARVLARYHVCVVGPTAPGNRNGGTTGNCMRGWGEAAAVVPHARYVRRFSPLLEGPRQLPTMSGNRCLFRRRLIRPSQPPTSNTMTLALRLLLRPTTRVRCRCHAARQIPRLAARPANTRTYAAAAAAVPAAELRFGQPLHETHPHLLKAGEGDDHAVHLLPYTNLPQQSRPVSQPSSTTTDGAPSPKNSPQTLSPSSPPPT
jgi:hypothetical protein